MNRVHVALLVCCVGCPGMAIAEDQTPRWVRVTERAAFTPRDSCGELVFQGRMWLLGGWMNSHEDPPRDVWSSTDGVTWTCVTPQAEWKHSDFPMVAVFQDRMWLMGGWHGGRLAHASASNAVWSSSDGKDWRLETSAAGWTPRMAGGIAVFHDRIWILGGTQQYYFGSDRDLCHDVWSSTDGRSWQCVTEKAPWAPRAYHQVVVHEGKLWVIGGGNYVPNYQAYNDVWCSEDGAHWSLVTDHAAWSPRIWFSAAVFGGRMWVLGGWSNHPSRNWNDVWTSVDGRTWSEFKAEEVWKPRHEHSVYVHQDRLWVVGGHAAPLVNDVWRLELPAGWLATK